MRIENRKDFKCQCGSKEFYAGPHGGAGQNFKCANPDCGKVYTIVPWVDDTIVVEEAT
jgi:hypothetical protein